MSPNQPRDPSKSDGETRASRAARVLAILAALSITASASLASAQIAGAEAEVGPSPASPAAPAAASPSSAPARHLPAPRHALKAPRVAQNAGPAAGSAPQLVLAPAAASPLAASGAASGPTGAPASAAPATATNGGGAAPATSSAAPMSSAAISSVPAARACLPECRSGFVCREGECVSACNPGCSENETCNAKRECVPRAESSEPYPYDKTRFGIGGQFGVGSVADGTGTPIGGHLSVAIPLGNHFYTREDVIASYYSTSTTDSPYLGGAVSAAGTTSVDQSYLLIALRATAGAQLTSLVSARVGLLAGSHTLSARHGQCGIGPQEKNDSSIALGGTGAIALTMKHVDLSLVADAYRANTQALCTVVVNTLGAAQGAQLVPEKQFAAQFLAQGTILF